MTDIVRLALIGCGRQMGQNLVPFLQRLEGHCIVACVDDELPLARLMQARTGAAHAVATVAELDLDAIDAAVLAVPPQPSSALTRYLVERGISCFVEKPAGESTAALAGLDEVLRHSDARVQVGFNFRYAEALQQLYSLTRRTRTTPSTVSINFFSRHPEKPQWGVESTLEAWIRHNGVHALDLARWFLPAPVGKIDVHAIQRDPNHFLATIFMRHTDGSLSVLRVGNHTKKFVVEVSVQGADGNTFTAPSLEQVVLELDAGTPSRALLHTTRNLDHGWARSGFGPELEAFLAGCRSPKSGLSVREQPLDHVGLQVIGGIVEERPLDHVRIERDVDVEAEDAALHVALPEVELGPAVNGGACPLPDAPSVGDALAASRLCDLVMEELSFDAVRSAVDFEVDRAPAVG